MKLTKLCLHLTKSSSVHERDIGSIGGAESICLNISLKPLTMPYQMSIISKYVEERTELNTDAPIAQRIECPATNR